MAHDVFICHSSGDKIIANAACAHLEAHGIRCWIAPRDPIAGIPYGRQLVEAIAQTRIVILIFSAKANASEAVLSELELAYKRGKNIVPFRIELVLPEGDLEYYIQRVHWLDAMNPPMEQKLDQLVELVRRVLATAPGLTPPLAAAPEVAASERAIIDAKPDAVTAPVLQRRVALPFIGGANVPVVALAGVALAVALGAAGLAFGLHPHAGSPLAQNPGVAVASVADDAGVARVSLAQGDVAIRRADDQQNALAAAINAPLFAGDMLVTGLNADAETHLAADWVMRLASQTQTRFQNLEPGSRELQLLQGNVELRILGHAQDAPPQIDTPSVSVIANEPGAYRIAVVGDPYTEVTVRSGRAEIVLPQGNQIVNAGETVIATGPASNPQIEHVTAQQKDAFDAFNDTRDVSETAMLSHQPEDAGDGVAELAAYGRWVDSPAHGRVWVPAQSPEWTPYSEGRWVWENGTGWTWVDNEPWGWAPYHYGRWTHDAGLGWAWVPGPPAAWQPALVAFFVGAGAVAWVALAPGEAYHPWFGPNGTVPAVADVSNVNIAAAYRNAPYVRAVRSIPISRFQRGEFGRYAFVPPAGLRRFAVVHGALPVVPTRADLRYSSRVVAAPPIARHASFAGRPVATTSVAFVQQRKQVAKVVGQPLVGRRPSANIARGRPLHAPAQSAYHPALRSANGSIYRPSINHAVTYHPVTSHSATSRPAYRPPSHSTTYRPAYRPPSHSTTYRPAYHPPAYRPPAYRPPTYRPPVSAYRPAVPMYRPPVPAYRPPVYRPPGFAPNTRPGGFVPVQPRAVPTPHR
jgi:hypothetical protein